MLAFPSLVGWVRYTQRQSRLVGQLNALPIDVLTVIQSQFRQLQEDVASQNIGLPIG